MTNQEPMLISGIIDRFESDSVIIITADQHQITWPKNHLPENIKTGDEVSLTLFKKNMTASPDLAKAVLNEILNTNEKPASTTTAD